ncbi:MAG: MarR family transcriptional regulator [Hyphomicrobiaceae bacterium]|nr:MarR family transcriptional regulator [Hyphomicrobiaceae bacterium]
MPTQNTDPLNDSMLHLLHRAGQVADVLFSEEMRGSDLTPRQFAVLQVLERLETASQTEIVNETGIDRSTLADIVKRLVARGLIARRRSKTDARAYAVRLTAAGKAALGSARPASARVESRLLKVLPQARRDAFVDSLMQLVRSLAEPVSEETSR